MDNLLVMMSSPTLTARHVPNGMNLAWLKRADLDWKTWAQLTCGCSYKIVTKSKAEPLVVDNGHYLKAQPILRARHA